MISKVMPKLPKPLAGFESINHYWDPTNGMPAAKILPGEFYVTRHDEIITTVLGSCVSACIYDLEANIGGMNHFMLPISDGHGWNNSKDLLSTANRYGNYAMEHMINNILKSGGKRRNLRVKIFGGGKVISSLSDIGLKNVQFVREYIDDEGLELVSEDVGDNFPRKILFFPITGKVLVKKLRRLKNDTILKREHSYHSFIERRPVSGDVELFD